MLIGMGGLWLEFKTPGFGFFGLLGATCLVLFFFGHHIAGLSGMEDLILFIIGIINRCRIIYNTRIWYYWVKWFDNIIIFTSKCND